MRVSKHAILSDRVNPIVKVFTDFFLFFAE